MSASLLPNAEQQFIDINGKPLVAGTVAMYAPGTLTKKDTWQDPLQTILNTNPIILNSRGQAIIYGNGNYRQVVSDSLGNLIWDQLTSSFSSFFFVTPELFGAKMDGTTNDAAAIQSAFNYGAANNLPVWGGGGTYKILSGLTIDVSKTSFQGNGCVFDASSFTNQTALTITCSGTDPSQLAFTNASHPVSGVVLFGPDGTAGGNTSIGLNLSPVTISTVPWIPNVTLRDGGVAGFNIGIALSSGAFNLDFDNFNIGQYGAARINKCLVLNTGTNCGERMVIRGAQIFNYAAKAIEVNMTCDLYLQNCSIDGDFRMIENNGSFPVFANSCHFENLSADNDYLFYTSTANSSITLIGGQILLDVARTTHEIGYSAVAGSTPNVSSIQFIGTQISVGTYVPDTLIGGPGSARASMLQLTTNPAKIPLSVGSNIFRDGLFTNSNALLDWTQVGTWSIDATTGPTPATTSVKTIVASGNGSLTSGSYRCTPGQVGAFSFWMKNSGLVAAGGGVQWTITFFDTNGHALSPAQTGTSAIDTAAWTHFQLQAPNPAPAGTATAQFQFFVSAPTGTATFWFSRAYASLF